MNLAVEGGNLHVEVQGAGEPVLLVHGLFASGYCWRHTAARLAESYRVYNLDLLGFGRSDMPPDADYSQSAQARRVLQTVAGLGLEGVRLVGHSMGGEIAVRAVLQDPRPFRQLVLVAADGFRRPFRPWTRHLLSHPYMGWFVRRTFDEKHFRHSIRTVVHDHRIYTPEMVAAYCEPYKRPEFPEAMRRLAHDREGGLSPDECRAITLPTLLLWGERDFIVPRRIGDRYKDVLPNARYRTRAQCGHMPMEEHPEWLNGEILNFFAADARADKSTADS